MEQLGEAFNEIQRIIANSLKKVLFFVDDSEQKQQFVDLIGDKEIEVIPAITKLEALKHLEMAKFDCIILDADVEQGSGLKLLEPLYNDDKLSKIPVIVYASRELSSSEESLLQQCMDTLTIKTVRSPERLLDESTLFLHQEEAQS
ncbi:MAG: response regulator [Methylococcales bacterium]